MNITKDPPKPPFIEVVSGSLQFIDSDDNNKIDANENTSIRFELKNTGSGAGLNLTTDVKETNNVTGLTFDTGKSLGTLQPGATQTVEIPVSGKMSLQENKAAFEIAVKEANGFGIDPVKIEIETQAFIKPVVKIVDYTVTSQNVTTLQKKRPFEVQVLVQNIGQGRAENVKINLPVPENMFCLSDNDVVNIGALAPGASKLLEYNLIANNNYTANVIPLKFALTERYGKYTEDRTISLTMNQTISDTKLVVQGRNEQEKEIVVGSLTSVVDKNITFNNNKNPDRLALIIGNEDYTGSLNAEINVEYARNDAEIFRKYAINCLGVEERNVYFFTDATAGLMRSKIELVAKLLSKMGSDAELIFYYAGHGFPDESTRVPYLIPVDVNATNLDAAIKLPDIYKQFSQSGAKRITVFLDACFSGGGRNQGLLAARGVKIKPKTGTLAGNMIVFSASTGEQSALPYNDEKHGMFTFFLLKKLQVTKGNITYDELSKYLESKVSVESLRINGKEQDPEVNVSLDVEDVWKLWKMR
ncbi:MAG: caspase family protein [Bacteroidales bacterium]|nr:caspase family protein [Bacteroidales bacterium]